MTAVCAPQGRAGSRRVACVALHGGMALRIAYQVVGFGLPAYFTHRYTKRIRERSAAQLATVAGA